MNLNKKNLWKPMEPNKVKRRYWTAAGAAVLCLCCVTPAMAAGGDPLDIVNNLSDFIFSIIKALGVIILGWGIVQVGMSIQSHDASQRTQGFLCLFGGLMIAFAKEILTAIGAIDKKSREILPCGGSPGSFVGGDFHLDNNWIVENLTNAFGVWNSKMTEMWSLLTESPQTFKGGTIWQTIVTINGGMQAIGYGLLVLFFAIGIFRSASGFRDFQRPEHLLRHFIYFVLAKLGITYGMDLLVDVFDVCSGIVATAAGSVGGLTGASVALPQEIADAIGDVGFLASIPLWLVTLLGSLMITVLAFIMILTVYGRFFKIYMYAALSPVALASFAGEGTSHFGKAFLRSYVGVCMEGAVIVLACIIFSAFSSSGTPVVDSSASVVTQVWSYLGEVIFNLLVLVGLVKSADHIAKEMLGL